MAESQADSFIDSLAASGGETGRLIAKRDWSRGPLGPVHRWPQNLRTALGLVLPSTVPIVMLWGDDGVMLYNDAYSGFALARHPELLGSKVREGWPEVADFNDNVMRVVLAGGKLAYKDQELTLHRRGYPEQVWMNLDYSPVLDERGVPVGVIAIVIETTQRVLAERGREAAELRSSEVLEGMAEGFLLLDGDYRVSAINAEGMRVDHRPREAILGRSHWEVWPGSEESEVGRLYKQAMQDRLPASLEHRYDWADGHYAWLDTRVYPSGDGLAVFYRDVTERKRVEAAASEESRSLETLNRTGAALSGELDLERLVQMVTDAGAELTGAKFGAYFHNVMDETGERLHLFTLSGEERASFERLGRPRATAIFGPTFRNEGVVRSDDILADPRYGQNAPHRGMPKGHLPVRSYLAVSVVSRSGEVLGGLLFGHPAPGRFTERHERLMIGLAAQASIAIDNARLFQEVQRSKATLEERVAERTLELTTAHESLRQAQKMEAVGQLTGGIAHDFNNLLTGVTGSLELIRSRMAQGRFDAVERYMHAAEGAAKRAAALTQRLLAFSRRQTLDPRPTDLNRLVAGMEDILRRTVGPSVSIEVVGAGGLWPTLVDASQLDNALLNLCINGRDAMPDGGRLTIETANKWLDDRSAVERDLAPGQYVTLCVTDTGTGMTSEVMARAFDPFFTTKPIGSGTGLGLSMIYGFVRQSGGQVRIYSELGRGTTMCLYFPRHVGEADEPAANWTRSKAAPSAAGETVLVVDDEPTVRMLLGEILEEAGYTAIEAADGAAGLKVLETAMRIDLLITDVGLPGGMNGRQVADAARVLRPNLKVLFITGYAENAAVGNGHLERGMQVVTKPFAMEAIASKIREMIES